MTENPRAARFRDLHRGGTFVMANPWDAGSAVLLASAGFAALGTTSAGIAFALGLPDHQRVDRATMLARVRAIAAAVDVPVSADLEASYGATADEVATTIGLAARAAADRRGQPFTLTACVRRISLGGSLARATYGLMRRAAQEILGPGTFGYADGQIGHAELCALFDR